MRSRMGSQCIVFSSGSGTVAFTSIENEFNGLNLKSLKSIQVFGFAAIQERVSIVHARQNKTADDMVFSVLIKKFSDTADISEMIINRRDETINLLCHRHMTVKYDAEVAN